jgi:hypothetical protein
VYSAEFAERRDTRSFLLCDPNSRAIASIFDDGVFRIMPINKVTAVMTRCFHISPALLDPLQPRMRVLDMQALRAVVAKNGEPHGSARSGGVAPADAQHEPAAAVSCRRSEHGHAAVSTATQCGQPEAP